MKRPAILLVSMAVPALMAAAALAADPPTDGAMSLVQTITIEKPEAAQNAGLRSVRVHGRFVYLHPQAHGKLLWYRRGDDGLLVEAGSMEMKLDKGVSQSGMVFVGERLYMVRLGPGRAGRPVHVVWYQVDPETGRPTEKGLLDAKVTAFPSVSYEPLVVSPDGKQLYLLAANRAGGSKVVWFQLDASGRPSVGGQVAGEGIGFAAKLLGDTSLRISPDGRHLYTISGDDHKLAILQRGEDGSLKHVKAVDLAVVAPKPGPPDSKAWNQTFSWPGLAISPDGKFVYVNLWAYGNSQGNVIGLFRRDADSGELTFVEKLKWPAALKGFSIAFSPDGRYAYMGHLNGPAVHARRDPATGRLTPLAAFPQTSGPERRGPCIYDMTLDAKAGYAYFADVYGKLFVFKL